MRAVAWTLLFLALPVSGAIAVDKPPAEVKSQRTWLMRHLSADMHAAVGFENVKPGHVGTSIGALKTEDVRLLADFYYLSRKVAERDLRQQQQLLLQAQPQPAVLGQAQPAPPQPPPAQPAAALAARTAEEQADNEELSKLGEQLDRQPKAVRLVSEWVYASLPGWCVLNQQAVPVAYFNNNRYVGPLSSLLLAGPYAITVYAPQTYVSVGTLLVDQRRWHSMLPANGSLAAAGSGTVSGGPQHGGAMRPGGSPYYYGPLPGMNRPVVRPTAPTPVGSRGTQNIPLNNQRNH